MDDFRSSKYFVLILIPVGGAMEFLICFLAKAIG